MRLADPSKGELTHKEWIGARALANAMRDAVPESIVLSVARRAKVMERVPPQKTPRWPTPTPTPSAPCAIATQPNVTATQVQAPTVTSLYVSGRRHDDEESALIGVWYASNDARNLSRRFACGGGGQIAAILAISLGVEAAVRSLETKGGADEIEIVSAGVASFTMTGTQLSHSLASSSAKLRYAAIDSKRRGPISAALNEVEAEAIRRIRRVLCSAPRVRVRHADETEMDTLGIRGARTLCDDAHDYEIISGMWAGGAELGLKDIVEKDVDVENAAVVEDVAVVEDAIIIEDVVVMGDVAVVEDVAIVEEVIVMENVVAVEDVAVEDQQQPESLEPGCSAQPSAIHTSPSATRDLSNAEPVEVPAQHDSIPSLRDSKKLSRRERRRLRLSIAPTVQPLETISTSRPEPASVPSFGATIRSLQAFIYPAYALLISTKPFTHTKPPNSIPQPFDVSFRQARDVVDIWRAEKDRWLEVLPLIARKMAGTDDGKRLTSEEKWARSTFRVWAKRVRHLNTVKWPEPVGEGAHEEPVGSRPEDILASPPSEEFKLSKTQRRRKNRQGREVLAELAELPEALVLTSEIPFFSKRPSALPASGSEDSATASSQSLSCDVVVHAAPEIVRDVRSGLPSPTFVQSYEAGNISPDSDEAPSAGDDAADPHAEPLDEHEREELARTEELLSRWDDLTENERHDAETLARGLIRRLSDDGPSHSLSDDGNDEDQDSGLSAFLEGDGCAERAFGAYEEYLKGELTSDERVQQAQAAEPATQSNLGFGLHGADDTWDIKPTTAPVAAAIDADGTLDVVEPSPIPISCSIPSVIAVPNSAGYQQGADMNAWRAIADYGDSDDDSSCASSAASEAEVFVKALPTRLSSPFNLASLRATSKSAVAVPAVPSLSATTAHGRQSFTGIRARVASSQILADAAVQESRSRYLADVQDVQRKAERQIPLTVREEALLEKHTAWVAAGSSPRRFDVTRMNTSVSIRLLPSSSRADGR